MSASPPAPKPPFVSPVGLLIWLAIAAVLAWFFVAYAAPELDVATPRLKAPDWNLLLRQDPAVLVHLFAVLPAVVIGVWQLVAPKGGPAHKTRGWLWSALMVLTAVSSLFVRQLNDGAFSLIHLLSAWTLLTLPVAVWAARTGRVALHKRMITGLFLGGTLIAGAFALLPGRLLWSVLFA